MLAIAGLALAALTLYLVWWSSDRSWHTLAIVALAVPLIPLLAASITGDVSRCLPAWIFSEGADGKDQIVIASAAATIMLALILAACAWRAATAAWRWLRGR
ncbi:MAG TPA: hypothetical protein VGF53_01045 [Pseudolabrys sp.]|jgi:hypothetical protein